MATTMEYTISALVIIAIIVSTSTLWYGMTVVSDVSKLTDSVAELAGSVAELTSSVADFKTTTAEDLAAIEDRGEPFYYTVDARTGEAESSLPWLEGLNLYPMHWWGNESVPPFPPEEYWQGKLFVCHGD